MVIDYEAEIRSIVREKGGANTTSSASVELVVEEVGGTIGFINAMLTQPGIPASKREMFGVALERLNVALYQFTRDTLLVEGNPNEIRRRLGER